MEIALIGRIDTPVSELECPTARTQQRGTQSARNDNFSYNGRNELTLPPWEIMPTPTATTTSATARRHGNWPKNSPTRPTNSTSTPPSKKKTGPSFAPQYNASGNQTLITASRASQTMACLELKMQIYVFYTVGSHFVLFGVFINIKDKARRKVL